MDSRINVTKTSMPPFEEYVNELESIWKTRWLTNMGEKHNELEKRLKEYLGIDNISLTVNGHMALEIALQTLDISGEVITSPFTFASTTHSIVRSGLTPVFCDIYDNDFTIDVSKIENLITDKTSAIMPIHVYGNICNVDEIERIARKYNLKVIYDAAHAFGVRYKGTSVLKYGDMSVLSFHATKVFQTIEGGAICYRNSALSTPIYKMRDFGISDEDTVDTVGTNAKMNEFAASMGLCNLRHIDEEISKRKKVVEQYQDLLIGLPGIQLNYSSNDVQSNYAYFPIVIDEKKSGYTRDEIYEYLKSKNIYARKYFYPLTSEFECYRERFVSNQTPKALYISKRVLTLPLYADMTSEEIKRVCKAFHDWRYKANA